MLFVHAVRVHATDPSGTLMSVSACGLIAFQYGTEP